MKRNTVAIMFILGLGSAFVLPGCPSTGVGDPCIPDQEYDPSFKGFSETQVVVESKSFQCQTRLCLVNHFRGRVSCPQGENSGETSCKVPGTDTSVVPVSDTKCVASQCKERSIDTSVYCSCRCANADGKTDDGAAYCSCPDSFECRQLVTPTGLGNEGLTGAYCIKKNTAYDSAKGCSKLNPANVCDPEL